MKIKYILLLCICLTFCFSVTCFADDSTDVSRPVDSTESEVTVKDGVLPDKVSIEVRDMGYTYVGLEKGQRYYLDENTNWQAELHTIDPKLSSYNTRCGVVINSAYASVFWYTDAPQDVLCDAVLSQQQITQSDNYVMCNNVPIVYDKLMNSCKVQYTNGIYICNELNESSWTVEKYNTLVLSPDVHVFTSVEDCYTYLETGIDNEKALTINKKEYTDVLGTPYALYSDMYKSILHSNDFIELTCALPRGIGCGAQYDNGDYNCVRWIVNYYRYDSDCDNGHTDGTYHAYTIDYKDYEYTTSETQGGQSTIFINNDDFDDKNSKVSQSLTFESDTKHTWNIYVNGKNDSHHDRIEVQVLIESKQGSSILYSKSAYMYHDCIEGYDNSYELRNTDDNELVKDEDDLKADGAIAPEVDDTTIKDDILDTGGSYTDKVVGGWTWHDFYAMIKSGFNLFGSDGILSLYASFFSYLPLSILSMITFTLAMFCMFSLIKFILNLFGV